MLFKCVLETRLNLLETVESKSPLHKNQQTSPHNLCIP